MTTGHTTVLARWLERLDVDHPAAREAVIEHTCERLRKMTRSMLRKSPKVRRFEQTDDLLQDALVRLHRSLAEVKPTTAKEFYGLAATQIRRQLIDLARKHYGSEGMGINQVGDGGVVLNQVALPPDSLTDWTEFHEQIDRLPDPEKEVVHLLWYEGLAQSEAAHLLGISLATLKRRWQSARLRLTDWMGGNCPA